MNQQERDELLRFLQPLLRSRAADKDFVAETLILEQCARQPDALYLLVQRAMALHSALAAAQSRIAELQARDAADGDGPLAQAAPSPAGAWGRGLRGQVATLGAGAVRRSGMGSVVGSVVGTAVGVAAGVVAGGLLLDAIDGPDGDGLSAGLGDTLGDIFGAGV
jgi:hypothetical protein